MPVHTHTHTREHANTCVQLDDGRSEADSELSAPDEYQRYYPSNSEEDHSVDEQGRKQLPKGMDMTGRWCAQPLRPHRGCP